MNGPFLMSIFILPVRQVNFDDNASYRQKEIHEKRDVSQENPIEVEAKKYDLNYIKLDTFRHFMDIFWICLQDVHVRSCFFHGFSCFSMIFFLLNHPLVAGPKNHRQLRTATWRAW